MRCACTVRTHHQERLRMPEARPRRVWISAAPVRQPGTELGATPLVQVFGDTSKHSNTSTANAAVHNGCCGAMLLPASHHSHHSHSRAAHAAAPPPPPACSLLCSPAACTSLRHAAGRGAAHARTRTRSRRPPLAAPLLPPGPAPTTTTTTSPQPGAMLPGPLPPLAPPAPPPALPLTPPGLCLTTTCAPGCACVHVGVLLQDAQQCCRGGLRVRGQWPRLPCYCWAVRPCCESAVGGVWLCTDGGHLLPCALVCGRMQAVCACGTRHDHPARPLRRTRAPPPLPTTPHSTPPARPLTRPPRARTPRPAGPPPPRGASC